jgi:hypothetical protein
MRVGQFFKYGNQLDLLVNVLENRQSAQGGSGKFQLFTGGVPISL